MKATFSALVLFFVFVAASARLLAEDFVPPPSPHRVFNFNSGWKFFKGDVTNAEQGGFDDSKWAEVSAPHTFNDVDSYTAIISHSGGDRKAWSGAVGIANISKLPAGAKDGKVFLEFEGFETGGAILGERKIGGQI